MNHILSPININILDKVDNVLFNITNDPYDLKNIRSIVSIFNDLVITKYKTILNNSIHTRAYYTNYDIRNIIKSNIDYTISNKMHINKIDDYIISGNILVLNKGFKDKYKDDYNVLNLIADDILKEDA